MARCSRVLEVSSCATGDDKDGGGTDLRSVGLTGMTVSYDLIEERQRVTETKRLRAKVMHHFFVSFFS